MEAAIAPFVHGEPDADSADELDPPRAARAVGTKGDGSVASGGLDTHPSFGDDMGVAISREELDDEDVPSKGERSLMPTVPSSREGEEKRATATKLAKANAEYGFTVKRGDNKRQRTGLDDGKNAKKKKKKKGGDEFDDMFSTLL